MVTLGALWHPVPGHNSMACRLRTFHVVPGDELLLVFSKPKLPEAYREGFTADGAPAPRMHRRVRWDARQLGKAEWPEHTARIVESGLKKQS